MRLTDADALKQTFCAECDHSIKCEDCDIDYHFEHLAPTVDPVKHGHWVEQEHEDWKWSKEYRCSECGKYRLMTNPFGREWNYCPNCGAKMDEVEK